MGMFDYVEVNTRCPKCDKKLKDLQSKDRYCEMLTIPFYEVNHFYTTCPKCNLWIDFKLKPEKMPVRPIYELNDYEITTSKLPEIRRVKKKSVRKIG